MRHEGFPVQRLFAALHHNQEQTIRFFGIIAGTVPIAEFFAAENPAGSAMPEYKPQLALSAAPRVAGDEWADAAGVLHTLPPNNRRLVGQPIEQVHHRSVFLTIESGKSVVG